MMTEDEQEELKIANYKLQRDLNNDKATIVHLEGGMEKLQKENDELKEEKTTYHWTLHASQQRQAEQERELNERGRQIDSYGAKNLALEEDKKKAEKETGEWMVKFDKEEKKLESLRIQWIKFEKDAKGLNLLNTELQKEKEAAEEEKTRLQQRIDDLEHVELELEQEKRRTELLNTQIAKQRTEMPRFDLNPQAYRTNTIPSAKNPDGSPKKEKVKESKTKTLELELEEDGNPPSVRDSSSSSSSDDETDDDEDEDGKSGTGPTVTVTKTVRVIRKVPVWLPWNVRLLVTYAFLTWVDAFGYISIWTREAFNRVARPFRRRFTVTSGSPAPSPPHSPTGTGGGGGGGDGPPPRDEEVTSPVDESGKSSSTSDGKREEKENSDKPPTPEPEGNGPVSPLSPPVTKSPTSSRPTSKSSIKSVDSAEVNFNQFQAPSNDAFGTGNGTDSWIDGNPFNNDGAGSGIHMYMATVGGRNSPIAPPAPSSGEFEGLDPELSKLIPPAPPQGTGEKIRIASDTPGPLPPRPDHVFHTRTPLTLSPEEVERLYPPGPSDSEVVETINVNDPRAASEPSIWTRLTDPDIASLPSVWTTFSNLLIQLLFLWFCWNMWIVNSEKQKWVEANDIARGFFDDLYHARDQYGRGFTARLLEEDWAWKVERFGAYVGGLLGFERKAYPMPG